MLILLPNYGVPETFKQQAKAYLPDEMLDILGLI